MSLRTLLCMILYTQGASMMSTCYSFISMAVAASLQMGLFTVASCSLSDEEKAIGHTISVVLFIMDTYVSTALGLPRALRDIEMNRVAPGLETLQHIHHEFLATCAHARLARILATIVEANHPATRQIPHRNGLYGKTGR